MAKRTKCWECWGLDGIHAAYCQSRGYGGAGPHPDAPAVAAPHRVDPTPCPCGIARAGRWLAVAFKRHVPRASLDPIPEWARTPHGFYVVSGPGVYITAVDGSEIEMPIGSIIAFEFKP